MAKVVTLEDTEPGEAEKAAASAVLDRSHDDLYATVESMDKAVLVELTTALGGLVQSMYLEKERTRIEEQVKLDRDLRRRNEELARRLQAEEEAKERREREQALAYANIPGVDPQRASAAGIQPIPDRIVNMLLTGAMFLKVGFLGRRQSGFYSLAPDMVALHSKPSPTGGEVVSTPLSSFER
jgi:hypothetical protein